MKRIDINCDMGESHGNFKVGRDTEIFPHITSSNIACGMHAGDPYHIERTIDLALQHGVQIGAHPGYPDLQGFGRRVIPMKRDELKAYIKYQVAALKGMVESAGGKLAYVKPHGALYNEMAANASEAETVIAGIKAIDPELIVMGLAGSHVADIAATANMAFVAEAFADRRYEANGKLRSRLKEQSVFDSAEEAANQVVSITLDGHTQTLEGDRVNIEAQSFCIHGDNPAAIKILKSITDQLAAKGITKEAFSRS